MEKSLQLDIVTPDKLVLSENVEYVGAPGYEGEFGVLPNHISFLAALQIGNLHYKSQGKTNFVFISGGFADISDNKVTILAESAEKAEEIDLARARQAKERAEARLQKQKEELDYARAKAALERAMFRMRACETCK